MHELLPLLLLLVFFIPGGTTASGSRFTTTLLVPSDQNLISVSQPLSENIYKRQDAYIKVTTSAQAKKEERPW